MKVGTAYLVEFFRKLLEHEDRDRILQAIDEGVTIKNSHEKGAAFEAEVEEQARAWGFWFERGSGGRATDLIINGWRVQAKNVDRISGGMVDIANMRPVLANDGRRGYGGDEVDFVILKHRGEVFVIPVARILRFDGSLEGSIDPREFRDCINAWSVLSHTGPHGSGQRNFL